MRYLIDGHNLIAQLPDIDLADPDDEVQLVYRLRSFATRSHHTVVVVFDGGLPGGVSKKLSTSRVTVIFAADKRSTADKILINRLRSGQKAQTLTLVSSDREVIAAAQQQGIPVLRAGAFASRLNSPSENDPKQPEKDENPHVSPEEVETWLKLFSGEDEEE